MAERTVIYAAIAITLSLYLLKLLKKSRSSLPLPPGPKGYPFIGNIYDVPHHYAWLQYAQWAQKYGDIFSFSVLGNTTIILSSLEAVTEILEKRSSNYSDRPRMIMANELMEWEWDFGRMPYTDRWRRHRRMFHQYFQARNMANYYHIQKKLVVVFLDQLTRSPEDFTSHIRQYVSAYGYEVQGEGDFYIKLVHAAIQPLLLVVHATGNYLVEFLPQLKHIPIWMPGAGFKRKAEVWAKEARELRDIPFISVKKSIAEGTATRSFTYDNLEKIKFDKLKTADVEAEEEVVKNCAGLIYLAGSDTTTSLLMAWVLAMAHNPEVQKKGQEEVDRILGKTRLPEFSDRDSMPYVEAMILEIMRWFSITPLAVPHRAVKEDEYKGFRIPAGSTVTPNSWAILHDEKMYPEPFAFKPERFLKNGVINFETQPDPLLIGSFGYGRRNCPGRHLALNTAYIAIASMLTTSNIAKAVDNKGQTIEPLIEATDGLVSHPKPFQVQFTMRFNGVKDLIESAKAQIY